MTRWRLRVVVVTTLLVLVAASGVRAQWVVFDPSNYVQAIAQVQQLIRQYQFWIEQTRRVPVDLATRYHAHSLDWTFHDLTRGVHYAQPMLRALNEGDAAGAAYRALVAGLDVPTDVIGRMPPALRDRLTARYGALELQDSIARLAIDQTGLARTDGPFTLQAVRNVERDLANPADAFHSQTALLQKINAALAISVRLEEQTTKFQLTTLEQLLIDAARKRDAEARLMNATLHQWRYGAAYGEDLFRRTAEHIDTWRPF